MECYQTQWGPLKVPHEWYGQFKSVIDSQSLTDVVKKDICQAPPNWYS